MDILQISTTRRSLERNKVLESGGCCPIMCSPQPTQASLQARAPGMVTPIERPSLSGDSHQLFQLALWGTRAPRGTRGHGGWPCCGHVWPCHGGGEVADINNQPGSGTSQRRSRGNFLRVLPPCVRPSLHRDSATSWHRLAAVLRDQEIILWPDVAV